MKHTQAVHRALTAAALLGTLGMASAQGNAALDGIAKYREMLQDGNPAELFEMKGEELWKQKRGPKSATLEQCDLGKGPGVVKGAFTELPRFFKDTGKVPNVVNLATLTPATHMLVVRHRDKPGVLAHVFEYLRVAHLNVQETENIIFDGAQAAVARINLDGAPSARALDAMKSGNADILDLQLVKLS